VFAAAVQFTASRRTIPGKAVLAIVVANAVWAVDSVVAAAAQWGSPTTTGTVWIVLQALTVAGFAALQLASRKR
jgi:predicted tellurium resistance membrane protein TerC